MKHGCRSRGSAIIYVIILLVPVMFGAAVMMEMVSTDFSAGNSSISAQQALYNAEAGIEWGIKKLQLKNYDKDYASYNYNTLYIMDGASGFSSSRNCFKASISYSALRKTFTVNATGKYGDMSRALSRDISREELITLSRKFSCENLTVSSGRSYFQITSTVMGGKNQDKFLITNSEPSGNNPDIYTYIYGGGIDSAAAVDSPSFFKTSEERHNRLPDIKTPDNMRNQWIALTPEVQYFVSSVSSRTIIDPEGLLNPTDAFMQGFAGLSGDYSGGVFISGVVRVILIDGDLVLRGIRGDYEAGKLALSERFLGNLVIYCTGRVTIEDCDLRAYAGSTNPDSDIAFSIHSREIDFRSGSEGNIISYRSGNGSLITVGQQQKIIEAVKANTTPYSNWAIGF